MICPPLQQNEEPQLFSDTFSHPDVSIRSTFEFDSHRTDPKDLQLETNDMQSTSTDVETRKLSYRSPEMVVLARVTHAIQSIVAIHQNEHVHFCDARELDRLWLDFLRSHPFMPNPADTKSFFLIASPI